MNDTRIPIEITDSNNSESVILFEKEKNIMEDVKDVSPTIKISQDPIAIESVKDENSSMEDKIVRFDKNDSIIGINDKTPKLYPNQDTNSVEESENTGIVENTLLAPSILVNEQLLPPIIFMESFENAPRAIIKE